MLSKTKSRSVAALLALVGTFTPIPGLHKFYLGQPLWGLLYLLLAWTQIPRVACAIEGVWYLAQTQDDFDRNFNLKQEPASRLSVALPQASTIAEAMRQIDRLRQEGLISEYEFEQKRRQLLKLHYGKRSNLEIAAAAKLGNQIDVNQASVDDWLGLPGLSIYQARALVELSRSGVRFYCLEDIAAALNLPLQGLKPLEPVLQFCYYDEPLMPVLVNPNKATVEQLGQIPAIEPSLAKAIVQDRLALGPYQSLADFQQRLSLPGELIGQLMHYLRF